MRKIFIIISALFLLGLCSCLPKDDIEVEEKIIGQTVFDDNFTLTIVAENSQYKTDEPIVCYATVTYLGSEPVTLYHSSPLVAFAIEDGRYFEDGFFWQDVLLNTEFEPEEEKRFEFTKSGSWGADDPNAAFYEEFYKEDELMLPEGEYILSANLRYSTDKDDIAATKQTMTASISIKVKN